MTVKVLILAALTTTSAVKQLFSTVRSEEATSVEIDENGNIQDVTEDDSRPPLSELSMPKPSVLSHVQAPIVIVSIFAGPYDTKKDVWRNVAANHEEYADMHGYGYVQFNGLCTNRDDPLRLGDSSWDALLAIRDVQNRVDPSTWIFWMDPDSSFSNMTRKLEDFIKPDEGTDDPQAALIITGDTEGFSSGHFFIRADDWGKQFLAHAWSMFSFSPGHTAQHGMAAVLGGAEAEAKDTWPSAVEKLSGNWWHSETLEKIRRNLPADISSKVKLVEFRSLASDSEEPEEEDFIIHAAGEKIERSEKILREI